MLERMSDLPAGVLGLRAIGKVSKEDYDQVLLPLLEEARREGRAVRFLYQFGPEFEGFTAGGAWRDMQTGLRYLRLFERCAVVSDVEWIRGASRVFGALMPCPVGVYHDSERDQAVAWLKAPARADALTYRFLPERGVLLIEPHEKLGAEDFDALASAVDSWIEAHARLDGIVIRAREFPGWESVGSFLRHVRFVRDHHRKIRRVAVAADGKVAELAAGLVEHFVQAEIERFSFDDLDAAIEWAGGDVPGARAHA